MRPWKPTAAVAALAVCALVVPPFPDAIAGDRLLDRAGERIGIRLKKFLVGYLEPDTERFVAHNGRGADDCRRDYMILMEFSGPLDLTRVRPVNNLATIVDFSGNVIPNADYDPNPDFVHLNEHTIRIGTYGDDGRFLQAEGSFNEYVVRQFNPVSGNYDPKPTYRNSILFDPTKHLDAPESRNPAGFEANTEYSVILPGRDSGVVRTIRSRSGRPLLRTFRTTIRTVDAYHQDYIQPHLVGLEATDAPGVPLDARVGVDGSAGIVATFSEPMLASSFVLGTSFRVRDEASALDVSGSLAFSPGSRTCTFTPDSGFPPGPAVIEVTLTQGLTDRVANYLAEAVSVRFETAPAPPASSD